MSRSKTKTPERGMTALRAYLSADFDAIGAKKDPIRGVTALLMTPGLLSVAIMRVQTLLLHNYGRRRLSGMMRTLNVALTGADFEPGCSIGPGLRIEHPTGIVVGEDVKVGARCFILQGVTLGMKLVAEGDGSPVVGDDVMLGARSTVLGPVHIGDGARVGAHTLVLRDVAAGTTYTGANKPAS